VLTGTCSGGAYFTNLAQENGLHAVVFIAPYCQQARLTSAVVPSVIARSMDSARGSKRPPHGSHCVGKRPSALHFVFRRNFGVVC
jgi:hypothetical protein